MRFTGVPIFALDSVVDEERAGCFAFIVLWMTCYCKCSGALPRGAMGWSAVCERGIS